MKAAKIRIGVAGLGRIGWPFHCAQIAQHSQYEFVAVQDAAPERLEEARKVYGVHGYRDFSEMLAESRLDAVAIATPTPFHRPMATEALRAGCHVMLEKPMAPNATDAAAIVQEAARRRRVLTVYQPRRADAYFQHLKRMVDAGLVGQVYHVHVGMYQYVIRNDWQALRKFGGGMLNNYGAHALDQVLQLIGYEVKRVFCNLRLVASLGNAEDVVKIVLETRDHAIGEVDINQASAIVPFTLDVWGTRGAISLSQDTTQFRVRSFPAGGARQSGLDPALASAGRQYPRGQIRWRESVVPVDKRLAVDVYEDLARAIRTGARPFVRPEEPLALMRLIDRCREESGGIVSTSLFPRGGARRPPKRRAS